MGARLSFFLSGKRKRAERIASPRPRFYLRRLLFLKSDTLRSGLKLLTQELQCAKLIVQPVQLPAEDLLVVTLMHLQALNLQGPALAIRESNT